MSPLEIIRVPVLSDNYSWLVHDPDSGATMVIDPGEAQPARRRPAETEVSNQRRMSASNG